MTVRPVVGPDLSERDEAILADLARIRLLTGRQLERLHFANLSTPATRTNVRWRVLSRLITLGLVTTLERRIGGVRAGSAGLVYTLDAAGQHRAAILDGRGDARIRRPWAIGGMFVDHTLDVAELYVRIREQERAGHLRLQTYDAEPASWHQTGCLLLKPDAHAVWETNEWEQHRWIEVDRSTESLPTLRRKLLGYVDAANAGDLGPGGVLPRVLLTVISDRRMRAVQELVGALPEPAAQLIDVEIFEGAFVASDIAGARPPP